MKGHGTRNLGIFSGLAAACVMVACSSNPPPRPLPEPLGQRPTERPTERPQQRPAQGNAEAPQPLASTPTPPPAASSRTPAWYQQGAFDLGGREHRAFSVTAADVREARSEALRLAYEAYPAGAVAAHEAVRLADGRWTFYLLMASGG